MSNGNDPLEFAKRLAESYRNIKFGAGVVGKTSHATLALLFVWAIVLWRLTGNLWPDLALFAGGLIASGVYCWWVSGTQRFAKENPELALLEGAELLEYRKFEAQAKGMLPSPNEPLVIAPSNPRQAEDNS